MMRQFGDGWPEPLGLMLIGDGANIAVEAGAASDVWLCLFDEAGEREIERIRLVARTGDVWHAHVAGISAGTRYGLRAAGPWAPNAGHRFNPAKLLLDPFATRLDRPFVLDLSMFDAREKGAAVDDVDSAAAMPKAIAEAPFPSPLVARPRANWGDLVIYELHVRGFTKQHPGVPEPIRGTFAGLGHPAAIDHLVRLGVTAVEIMPASAWIDERHLGPLGLTNYWGYNPAAFCAPDPRLAPGGWPEVRAAVAALQCAGIAVLLDVVPNHTGEGDRHGPTLSLRGLANAASYRLVTEDQAHYLDDTGCGNTLALDRPLPLRLIMESLRTWALRAGLDGFRYDLATVMGRRPDGFTVDAPLLTAIGQDPTLRHLIHIAEPWDLGPGGYRLGGFPAGWGEWNDRYRDTVRRFWRADRGIIGSMATCLAGSSDVFSPRHRPVSRSLNFVTAHDGFTLADLVAFAGKHNLANGEENRDGTDGNHSWNNGIEGPSYDPAIRARRDRDVRALLATLLVSRGTPMISMGDEAGRTQRGNNNAYAQDNALSWFDWSNVDEALMEFTARLIALRKAVPALRAESALTGLPVVDSGIPDVDWRTPSGDRFDTSKWQDPDNRTLVAAFMVPAEEERAASRTVVIFHAGEASISVILPDPRELLTWHLALDSATGEFPDIPIDRAIDVGPRRVMVLLEQVR
jgi:glycogen debranching enzyme GlgX